jgi:excisionase family DNA binding protein
MINENLQKEALSISEVCAAVGIGRTKIYEAIANRNLKARKVGNRTLILRDELRQFLQSLPLSTVCRIERHRS